MSLLSILPLLGAIAGAFAMLGILDAFQISAPQRAAVFVRANENMVAPKAREPKRINERLTSHARLLA